MSLSLNLWMQLLVLLFNPYSYTLTTSSFVDYPSANVTNSWLNHPTSTNGYWKFSDGTHVRTILAVGRNGYPDFCFGFFNNGTANTFYLAILKLPIIDASNSTIDRYEFQSPPVVLWSANRDDPVPENSTLELHSYALLLRDANGTAVWNTNKTASIARVELLSGGNLRFVSSRNTDLWQSFLNPTNMWLPGQSLRLQGRLISSISEYNLAKGMFYLRLDDSAIRAFIFATPPQQYHYIFEYGKGKNVSDFGIMSLVFSGSNITYLAYGEDFQYLRLEPNGHLHLFQFDGYRGILYADLLEDNKYGGCEYPTVCGKYGVCNRGNCTCAGEATGDPEFFRPVNATEPSLGCREVNPLSCGDKKLHTFLELENVTYFRLNVSLSYVTAQTCKDVCMNNCTCRAVIFWYRDAITRGNCSLLADVFTLTDMATTTDDLNYKAVTYIKVQMQRRNKSRSVPLVILIPSLLGSLVFVVALGSSGYFWAWRNRHSAEVEKDGSFVKVSTLVKEFSFQDLSAATNGFKQQIGKGGFAFVYEGTMKNGTKVAVKRLNSSGKREFLTEVKTIGSIHHFNLVKLIGYCAERSRRFLVYEYVSNGSLDRWIFKDGASQLLCWETRKKIILGIADGLEYLHVGCNPNIIHFDIKPQNILLDEEFNVKIADFGLAKWINRDQGNISTMPKGTPGYIAPELIAGRNVSVKVDVYSFGIVVLEIVCGRKHSSTNHNGYLIDEVRRKAEGDQLLDLIDNDDEDLQGHGDEATRIIEIAIRCLEPCNTRPSMPTVLKLLEGSLDVEPLTDFSFLGVFRAPKVVNRSASTPPVESVLSGPR